MEVNDLEDYMKEYDNDWYIGHEKDPEWTKAAEKSTKQIFSLTHDPVAVSII